ncbi:Uncharacterised protein [Mycobacteroides abscessus subsp. abscessus]|nr:Uncharacterised protein [Mycobacteroides abscessus subsp. abscessus]
MNSREISRASGSSVNGTKAGCATRSSMASTGSAIRGIPKWRRTFGGTTATEGTAVTRVIAATAAAVKPPRMPPGTNPFTIRYSDSMES